MATTSRRSATRPSRPESELAGNPGGPCPSRTEVIDVRALVTVAEITSSARGLAAEVALTHDDVGLDRPSVVNCDGLHTVARSSLSTHVGTVDDGTMARVCGAVGYALGC